VLDGEDLAGSAAQQLEASIATVVRAAPTVTVRRRVAHGHPGVVLVDAAKDADLLVVGSHGHGGLVAALLGSVSTAYSTPPARSSLCAMAADGLALTRRSVPALSLLAGRVSGPT
jgi:universal stress protein family protein